MVELVSLLSTIITLDFLFKFVISSPIVYWAFFLEPLSQKIGNQRIVNGTNRNNDIS